MIVRNIFHFVIELSDVEANGFLSRALASTTMREYDLLRFQHDTIVRIEIEASGDYRISATDNNGNPHTITCANGKYSDDMMPNVFGFEREPLDYSEKAVLKFLREVLFYKEHIEHIPPGLHSQYCDRLKILK